VLGGLNFDRENELQMQKFKMFQKLYGQIFLTSYCGPNFDIGKASKSAIEVEGCAWHWRYTPSTGVARLTNCLIFHCFVPVFSFTLENHDFILVIYQLNVIMMLLELTRIDSSGKTSSCNVSVCLG